MIHHSSTHVKNFLLSHKPLNSTDLEKYKGPTGVQWLQRSRKAVKFNYTFLCDEI
ncbi:hypothetical protein Hanom_Chr09g00772161 [Helianthus anomalus]